MKVDDSGWQDWRGWTNVNRDSFGFYRLLRMSESDLPKIRVTDLSLRFGSNEVLNKVNLEIARGKNTVLIGGAATGKSVLMKCIIGLLEPHEGKIEIDGEDVTHLKGSRRVELMNRFGILFQRNALFDSLTIWENVAFYLINARHMNRGKARDIAMEKMQQVALGPEVATLFPVDLSGGMQKRVGLARAIAADPEILLLDAPTAGLDPIMTHSINRLVNNCVSELGATAMSITGDMTSARTQYDHLAMLHDQHIIWSGSTDEIDDAQNDYLQQLINGRAQGPIKMRLRARI